MSKSRLLLIFVVAFTAVSVTAQTSFIIERIDVNPGARVHVGIIRAETRLVAGRSYTHQSLDQALYRIRRLPFVIDATYTLEPGSSPLSRVMVISVVDQTRFNVVADVTAIALHGNTEAMTNTGIGVGFFTGMNGKLDLTTGGTFQYGTGLPTQGTIGDIALGYSAYGVFGTSTYGSAGITTRSRSNGGRSLNPSLLIGVPISQTQTVRARYQKTSESSLDASAMDIDWLFEGTDDPFFERRGLTIVAGGERTRQHDVRDIISGRLNEFDLHVDNLNDSQGVSATAEGYRPLAQYSASWSRLSASRIDEAIVDKSIATNVIKSSTHDSTLGVLFGLAHNFDSYREGSEDELRLRLEGGVGYVRSIRRLTPTFAETNSGPQANVGCAFRSRWGVVHIDFTFTAD